MENCVEPEIDEYLEIPVWNRLYLLHVIKHIMVGRWVEWQENPQRRFVGILGSFWYLSWCLRIQSLCAMFSVAGRLEFGIREENTARREYGYYEQFRGSRSGPERPYH